MGILTPRALLVLGVLSSACASSAPSPAPSSLPAHGEPARIELSATPGTGASGGTAHVQARVLDAYAATLKDVTVTFGVDGGRLDNATVTTDGNGVAATSLTADPGTVKIHASAGALPIAETSVTIQPIASGGAAPPPGPTPPVPSGPPDLPFKVSIGASAAPIGNATQFGLTAQGTVATAAWTFGDGGTGSGIAPSHTYASVNTYTVSVNATDTRGRTASASTTVDIPAAAYAVSLSPNPAAAATGANLVLTATVTPIGAPAVTTWTWDCDTSTLATDAATPTTATCVYPVAGTFIARVTVVGGGVTGTATTTVTVADPVPVITVVCAQPTPAALTENCHVDATLNGSAVLSSNITSVDWDFGDGTTTTATAGNSAPSHTYASAGPRTIRATNVIVVGTSAKGSGSANVTVQ